MAITVVNWNVAWARPSSPRGRELQWRIAAQQPDVVCITEGCADFLPSDGHIICSQADYGYQAPATRRKVLLWSKQPWFDVDTVGDESLPPGRFVAGSTRVQTASLRFVGVCVPWRDAHVRTGQRNRRPWEDHVTYLRGLVEYLRRAPTDEILLLGDFNQTIPRTRAPMPAWGALSAISKAGLHPATQGLQGDGDKPTIDHVFLGPRLRACSVEPLSRASADGFLSDHFGVKLVVVANGVPTGESLA